MGEKAVTLYIARHGKTMFNTIQRTQGWSDTPLTAEGIHGVTCLGLGLRKIPFLSAHSSDSGRAIETARLILDQLHQKDIPYSSDARIREWCFGSLEGGYDGELWGVIPRVLAFEDYDSMMEATINYEDLANAILGADTANWAEPYEQIKGRIMSGFKGIAEKAQAAGGGNVLVVSHGLTISHLLNLIDERTPLQINLQNASITKIAYQNGQFEILDINNTSYIAAGQQIIDQGAV